MRLITISMKHKCTIVLVYLKLTVQYFLTLTFALAKMQNGLERVFLRVIVLLIFS